MPELVGDQFTQQETQRKYDPVLGQAGKGDHLGKVLRFIPKTDYECSDQAFRVHVKEYAARNNLDFGFLPIKENRRTVHIEIAFVPAGQPLPHGLTRNKGREHEEEPQAA
jgi:hypothetical protein